MGLRDDYLKADKKEKTRILNEYIKNTKHNRKYVIAMLNTEDIWANSCSRKSRPRRYGPEIDAPLVKLWSIFDFPCGQRLKPCIEEELERLRMFGEIKISNKTTTLLKQMSSATIDRHLKVPRRTEHRRRFSTTRPGSLLKKKIPIRLTEWDTQKVGFLEVDLVAHCGGNTRGEFLNTVSLTDIATGWWEGQAITGKGQKSALEALRLMKQRTPFNWRGLDSDNGGEFINYPLGDFCHDNKIIFTRSRENKKNDNAYVEQKNWTHVRKILGYFRYDTAAEQTIINSLYHNELRFYKNFFQPVMKLSKKVRIGARKQRKYEPAKTPFKRLLESDQINETTGQQLKNLYKKLNPAALKRFIEKKTLLLYKVYQAKKKGRTLPRLKKEVTLG
jgi:hypothetical protein